VTNHSGRIRTFVHHEVSIPAPGGEATRRDVTDLVFFADRKYRELHPHISGGQQWVADDAYLIELRDDELVAVIKVEQT
jgi:hypothetical protein